MIQGTFTTEALTAATLLMSGGGCGSSTTVVNDVGVDISMGFDLHFPPGRDIQTPPHDLPTSADRADLIVAPMDVRADVATLPDVARDVPSDTLNMDRV